MREIIAPIETFECNGGERPPVDSLPQRPTPEIRDVYIKTLEACPVRVDICVPHRFRGKRVTVKIESV